MDTSAPNIESPQVLPPVPGADSDSALPAMPQYLLLELDKCGDPNGVVPVPDCAVFACDEDLVSLLARCRLAIEAGLDGDRFAEISIPFNRAEAWFDGAPVGDDGCLAFPGAEAHPWLERGATVWHDSSLPVNVHVDSKDCILWTDDKVGEESGEGSDVAANDADTEPDADDDEFDDEVMLRNLGAGRFRSSSSSLVVQVEWFNFVFNDKQDSDLTLVAHQVPFSAVPGLAERVDAKIAVLRRRYLKALQQEMSQQQQQQHELARGEEGQPAAANAAADNLEDAGEDAHDALRPRGG